MEIGSLVIELEVDTLAVTLHGEGWMEYVEYRGIKEFKVYDYNLFASHREGANKFREDSKLVKNKTYLLSAFGIRFQAASKFRSIPLYHLAPLPLVKVKVF